jgi:hypothetical protein
MGLKKCAKCSEMVDEAKAFCPGCGTAFVEEEKRDSASSFDAMDHTVQFGNTVYNQMLSDMGLNISAAPNAPKPEAKRIEVVIPAASPAVPPSPVVPEVKVKDPAPSSGNVKWIILGGVLVVLIFFLIVIVAALLFYFYGGRLK